MTARRPAEDPLEALARLERMARQGVQALRDGRASTGRAALIKIAESAADVRRHHREDVVTEPQR